MRLKGARVTHFRSVYDSEPFDVDQVTCLVGKNESGKSAILSAFHGLKPVDKFSYNKTADYPAKFLKIYAQRHGDREAEVIETEWVLEKDDIAAVEERLGKGSIGDKALVSRRYEDEETYWIVNVQKDVALRHFIKTGDIGDGLRKAAIKARTVEELRSIAETIQEPDARQQSLKAIDGFDPTQIAMDVLYERLPVFLYFDDYSIMPGHIPLESFITRQRNNALEADEQVFAALLQAADITPSSLIEQGYAELIPALRYAGGEVTKQVLARWQQDENLRVVFDVTAGRQNDPEGLNSGNVMHIRIEDRITATLPR